LTLQKPQDKFIKRSQSNILAVQRAFSMKPEPIIVPIFIGTPMPGLTRLPNLMPEINWQILSPHIHVDDRDRSITETYKALAHAVSRQISRGVLPISVAGDCVSSLGFLKGLQDADIRPDWLIWLDAHGDFHTEKTSQSNFLGGMPLAKLVGRGDQKLMRGIGTEAFPEQKVIHADGRDLDPDEDTNLKNSEIRQLDRVEDLETLTIKGDSVYLHIDTDVIGKKYVPAQNYAVAGGPSPRTLGKAISWLAHNCKIVGCSVSSWNPGMPNADRSATESLSVLDALWGRHTAL
jgi:arginase